VTATSNPLPLGPAPTDWEPDLLIQPSRPWTLTELRELWQYRELVYFLVVREINVRYRQTRLGWGWMVARPLLTMLMYGLVFGGVLKVATDGSPYPLFVMAGMGPRTHFYNAVTRSTTSLHDNVHVVSKVYFPRIVLPLAGTISGAVDMIASLLVFLGMMLVYRVTPQPQLLWLPVFFAASVVVALGAGLWLAGLALRFRDLTFALAFLLQLLLFATPVLYPLSQVPERYRFLYELNPVTGIVVGTRWALLGVGDMRWGMFAVQMGIAAVILVTGAYVFQYMVRARLDTL